MTRREVNRQPGISAAFSALMGWKKFQFHRIRLISRLLPHPRRELIGVSTFSTVFHVTWVDKFNLAMSRRLDDDEADNIATFWSSLMLDDSLASS
jgi:hypothetical protein